MKYGALELFETLNNLDETPWIEAKKASEIGKSILETICAFSNEPDLDGGYLLLGVSKVEDSLFPEYKIEGIDNPDKIQQDLVTQCATLFNSPIRPEIKVEKIRGYTVIVVFIPESQPSSKPIFLKSKGLPHGAFRRTGSVDVHCTTDDLRVFYQDTAITYDKTPVKGASIKSVDPAAIERYRFLRAKVNPAAEELNLPDNELLQALACVDSDNPETLNLTGLLVFGSSLLLRQHFPMLRIDYIRVPGNDWVPNPDERFRTIDMRGPLILMLNRLVEAINVDLPKGFLLEESLQATTTGLPVRALREAIVNAFIHRSYMEHSPTQIIRYDNRIEIRNPGFSLKSEDKLGLPGSLTRNPFIATIFHETNLAETKGSGIKAMRKYMTDAKLAPPIFESNRENNSFTARMLLHHFLDASDLVWLSKFSGLTLNDTQKQALIIVREIGAIDNQSYRQMADCEMSRASIDLRQMRNLNLLEIQGKSRGTYYTAGNLLKDSLVNQNIRTEGVVIKTEGADLTTDEVNLTTDALSESVRNISVIDAENVENIDNYNINHFSEEASGYNREKLLSEFPFALQGQIKSLKERERDTEKINKMILFICNVRAYKLAELACIFNRGDAHISRTYITPLLRDGRLEYTFPEMKSHPNQAYKSKTEKKN